MGVPKRKHSRSRSGNRASHQALKMPALSKCPQCGQPKIPHRVCHYCGYYKGRKVIELPEE